MSQLRAFGLPGVTLEPGDHICALYLSRRERDEIMLPFLRAGLEDGDKCICVVDSTPTSEVLESMSQQKDLKGHLASGQLELRSSADAYLRTRPFSAGRMIEYWTDVCRTAVQGGDYPFARATGEMPWSLRDLPEREEFVRYESELNRFAPAYPMALLCLYDLSHFGGKIVVDLLKTHPKLLLSGVLIESPHYLAPDQFLAERA